MKKLFFLLTFLFICSSHASFISNAITNITEEDDITFVTFNTSLAVQKGVSGYIVHHINADHQVIIANITVDSYNKDENEAVAKIVNGDILKQNALPHTTFEPQVGDEILVASDYSRALLLAPNETIYYHLTKAISNLEWIHPDKFAAFLSYIGHPTPQNEDIQYFCQMASVGLLYVYAENTLFTLDCKSLIALQSTSAPFTREKDQLPFYSRIENISKSWWGLSLFDTGNSEMLTYDYHYLHIIENSTPDMNISTQLSNAEEKLNKIVTQREKEKKDARKKAYNPLSKPSR